MEFIVMEITKEEREKILRDRVEAARRTEIEECGEVIKRALQRIEDLGGHTWMYVSLGKGRTSGISTISTSHIGVSTDKY